MPVYDVTALAEAFDADPRQIDNMLSRNNIRGVDRVTRGVTRKVTLDAAVTIRIALDLAEWLKVPFGHALKVGAQLSESSEFPVGNFGSFRVDVPAVRRATLEQLDLAVETVGKRPRGRPPRRAKSGV